MLCKKVDFVHPEEGVDMLRIHPAGGKIRLKSVIVAYPTLSHEASFPAAGLA